MAVSRKAWLGAGFGVAGGLAVIGASVWYFALHDVAEPTLVAEAVTTFREHPGSAASVPRGVYVYRTRGFEKTDALTGVTHHYPPRSTITVTGDACGVQLRWDVLRGRSTVWSFCIGSGGWTLERQDERHTFFGRTEQTDYRCPDFLFWSTAPTSSYTCSTGDSTERGERRLFAGDPFRVGSKPTPTVLVRRTSSFTGAIRGSSRYDFWLDRATGVPVRVVMESRTTNDSPVGAVHYQEQVSLRLTSLTPRR